MLFKFRLLDIILTDMLKPFDLKVARKADLFSQAEM